MPEIYDNIDNPLIQGLKDHLRVSASADFSIGYFNLRGWRLIESEIDRLPAGDPCCRVLVGMQRLPDEDLRRSFALSQMPANNDLSTAAVFRRQMAEEFREQLVLGAPSNEDEAGLRKLSTQVKAGKVAIKLFLGYPLHAKLYLLHRSDPTVPLIGFVGSSNLTMAGLQRQGELNVDVLDQDSCRKLKQWFEARWNDPLCIDISMELADLIDASWASETPVSPYNVYLFMAYHLSEEARTGALEFQIPKEFGNQLFKYQTAAIQIAAHHINRRGGVLLGDVVGLGKTVMATAVARIIEDDQSLETLILCPKNLTRMWEDYTHRYRLRAKVMSISQVLTHLRDLPRYRILILDESQNLRNREGKRYKIIQEYIQKNDCRCIFLSATPYNKGFQDLSSQLLLFVPPDRDLGIRPERLIHSLGGEAEFLARHQCPIRSINAFDQSTFTDDWQELMRMFMIRRTRSFIKKHYAEVEPGTGRKFLRLEDGTPSYFPDREPRTIPLEMTDDDPYAKLFSPHVVDTINALKLPRYGLGNYVIQTPASPPGTHEISIIDDLSRAGIGLMGFCRTNLFKRLESSGPSFLLSLERHILRNCIYLHAIETGQDIPIGKQDADLMLNEEQDLEEKMEATEEEGEVLTPAVGSQRFRNVQYFREMAAEVYAGYRERHKKRFKWLRSDLFTSDLRTHLTEDCASLTAILEERGKWDPKRDVKLEALKSLLLKTHVKDKVLVFTQFADTVNYLTEQLSPALGGQLEGVTGDSPDPTQAAYRFSPMSNKQRNKILPKDERRVLIATDVLSEGQNLQDAWVVVNYDLPWAIIRLVQRAGRVDRIGQASTKILCYSFLPADGVNSIIQLRNRLRDRLRENAEVVGTDDQFLDEQTDNFVKDLFTERSGIYDQDEGQETDIASQALHIWEDAIRKNPDLKVTIPAMQTVVYSTKPYEPTEGSPPGVLVYARAADGTDHLSWMDPKSQQVTTSPSVILKAAACQPDTPTVARQPNHHAWVRESLRAIEEYRTVGGQLGGRTRPRYRTYERLKAYRQRRLVEPSAIRLEELDVVIDQIFKYPLKKTASDTLTRQLRTGVTDEALAELVIALHAEKRLCAADDAGAGQAPRIICSLGLSEERRNA